MTRDSVIILGSFALFCSSYSSPYFVLEILLPGRGGRRETFQNPEKDSEV